MFRQIMFGLLFVAAGVTRTLGAQALSGWGTPRGILDPAVSQALREQLSAGYDQRREPSGVLQRLAPDRPTVRQVPVVPQAVASLDQGQRESQCPMPVAKADPRVSTKMPVVRADSTRLERMPVARSACVNPLEPK